MINISREMSDSKRIDWGTLQEQDGVWNDTWTLPSGETITFAERKELGLEDMTLKDWMAKYYD